MPLAADLQGETPGGWSRLRPYLLLAMATLFCLLPFSGKAFHIDDTLFLYTAQHITQHPFDPYGFEINWYRTAVPMWLETKNPPLASYFMAAGGELFGWSERALHLWFLLPALVVVLGTYHLARRFTNSAVVGAAATLLTPVFLISANTLMCDTLMLALWMLAIILWVEGMERERPLLLTVAAVLIGLCTVTKYFGIALVGLLLIYSWAKRRRLGEWAWCLAIPILMLAAYQQWTSSLDYGHMFSGAVRFARVYRHNDNVSLLGAALVDLTFLGGCVLPGLLFAPFLWRRKTIAIGAAISALAGLVIGRNWINLGAGGVFYVYQSHWVLVSVEAGFFIAGGLSILGMAVEDVWKRKDAESILLAAWVLGTFFFAGFVNYANNGRSILPLVPAAGILLARRVEKLWGASANRVSLRTAIPLALSGVLALWVACGDAALANSARQAATLIQEKTGGQSVTVWFEGHWGFQYYMERFGARAVDMDAPEVQPGDFLAAEAENAAYLQIRPRFAVERARIQIELPYWISTMQPGRGAGFYSSDDGPLPFVIGPVPAERYELLRLSVPKDWARALYAPKARLPLQR